jgi:hypothetical protein
MRSKLHAFPDAENRLLGFLMTADQISENNGAAALLGSLSEVHLLLAYRGYGAD